MRDQDSPTDFVVKLVAQAALYAIALLIAASLIEKIH
jgi:hypothetical protein